MSEVDYGPLALLAGTWTGDKGMDIAPEPDGQEQNPFYETIVFEPIGAVVNAEEQVLAALRYHQVVRRTSNGEVFHNESGYWTWDAARLTVTQTLSIPRGVVLVAGAALDSADVSEFTVTAALDDPDWPIAQAPFMRDNARTVAFEHRMALADDSLGYEEHTIVDIYGNRFDHSDANSLSRSD